MENNVIYDIIRRFCEKWVSNNGLMLLNPPTGTGKTYNVDYYIFKALVDNHPQLADKEAEKKRKFFFITSLKKNLPKEDIKRLFAEAGEEDLFSRAFLFLDANKDSVLLAYEEGYFDRIPAFIKEEQAYVDLENSIKVVRRLRIESQKDSNMRTTLNDALDTFDKNEKAFHKMLFRVMKKAFPTKEERLNAVQTGFSWDWLPLIYPACTIRSSQIIFMSVDKFLYPMSTIVEAPMYLYDSDILNNAVIFIDEFDSSKDTMLNCIIQSNRYKHINYIDMFNSIYSALINHVFPKSLLTPCKALDKNGKGASLQESLDDTKRFAIQVHEEFNLSYNYKTENVNDESVNNYLFHDHRYHSVLSNDKKLVFASPNDDDRINHILFVRPDEVTADGKEQGYINMVHMLKSIHNFIQYFLGVVRHLSYNYIGVKADEGIDFTMEEAIVSVLTEFGIKSQTLDSYYLTDQALSRSGSGKDDKAVLFDRTYYERGFCFYSFEDDYEHDMRSEISMCSYNMTPEKLLIRLCEKAKVLGISATATIPSKVGNYDIDYLKHRLKDNFVEITSDEKDRIAEAFRESMKGYKDNNVNIHAELLGCDNYSKKEWGKLVKNEDIAEELFNIVERMCRNTTGNNKRDFLGKRYLRVATAYKEFLIHADIYAFLCVLNKFPCDDAELNLKTLLEIFKFIAADCGMSSFDVGNSIVVLKSENFDAEKDKLHLRLKNGDRLFIMSTYQTIGAGQNLQYEIPDSQKGKLVKINDRPEGSNMDFNAIFLDKPTNLYPSLANGNTDNFEKFLFYIEMLQQAGEITYRTFSRCLKYAFKHFGVKNSTDDKNENEDSYIGNTLNSCTSISLMATKMAIQAVGRICRTNMKSPNIYVYGDKELDAYINLDTCRGQLLNYEFEELLDKLEEGKSRSKAKKPDPNDILEIKANNNSSGAYELVSTYERRPYTHRSMEGCRILRDFTLKQPFPADFSDDEYNLIYQFYVELPEGLDSYFYEQENDFESITIHFFNKENHYGIVSENASRLPYFMKVGVIKRYFEKMGYATTFGKGRYMLPPALFNNIYKGALGEAAGKALFEALAATELADIETPELYEKFDFYAPDTSVYVDFKNWSETMNKDAREELEHVAGKALECNARCVIIANIIAENSEWKIDHDHINGVEIVRISALLVGKDNPEPNLEAWREIRRCLSEYADKKSNKDE